MIKGWSWEGKIGKEKDYYFYWVVGIWIILFWCFGVSKFWVDCVGGWKDWVLIFLINMGILSVVLRV